MKNKEYKKHKSANKISDDVMRNGILIGCHHGLKISELRYMCKNFEKYFNKLKN